MPESSVLIIGGGVAGLSAALQLARFDVRSDIVDTAPFVGGHALGFACKAAEECVRCGACLAEEKLHEAVETPGIRIFPSSRVQSVRRENGGFKAAVRRSPQVVDPDRCTGCGTCLEACPAKGAVQRGPSPYNRPAFAVDPAACLRASGEECRLCVDACPESALSFDAKASDLHLTPDAVILATGFRAFDPRDKPYGYGQLEDVVTNLELERMLREEGRLIRPSCGSAPRSIAFVQCVGSRDERLGHLWCSRVCCGSALRMARRLRHQDPELEVTVFYIDIQTFGRDFGTTWVEWRDGIRFIRALPADAVPTDTKELRVSYFDPDSEAVDALDVDMLVLSVGITPGEDLAETAGLVGLHLGPDGFLQDLSGSEDEPVPGVAAAGTALGPMGITDAIKNASAAAWRTLQYLEGQSNVNKALKDILLIEDREAAVAAAEGFSESGFRVSRLCAAAPEPVPAPAETRQDGFEAKHETLGPCPASEPPLQKPAEPSPSATVVVQTPIWKADFEGLGLQPGEFVLFAFGFPEEAPPASPGGEKNAWETNGCISPEHGRRRPPLGHEGRARGRARSPGDPGVPGGRPLAAISR